MFAKFLVIHARLWCHEQIAHCARPALLKLLLDGWNIEQLQQQQRQFYTKSHGKLLKRLPAASGSRELQIVRRHMRRGVSNWRRQMEYNDKRRKVIPKLVYLHNPWKYFMTKLNIWKLMIFWDYEFDEREFIRGSTQAAVVLTNIIRSQDATNVGRYTTPIGFQQITRDMLLSRDDARLKLVKFEPEHIRRAIPMKVSRCSSFGRKYCFIDMLFVGLRNTKDFDSPEEAVEINETLRKLDADLKTPVEVLAVPHRIVFAEIFMRFRRDYSPRSVRGIETSKGNPGKETGWSVSFYKILTFDVLNYDPKA